MAQSTIQYDVFLSIGDAKLKFHTRDGGKHLQFVEISQLPDGVSRAAVESVLGKVIATLRAETIRIEQAQADSAERKRQAHEADSARIIAAEAENQRNARRNHFLRVEESRKTVKFDSASMWKTRDRNLAVKIAAEGVLEFLGPSDDYSYAFSDPDRIGNDLCRKCLQKSLKRSAPNSGGVRLVTCSNPACHYHDYESGEPPERPRSALHGRVQLVG